MPISLASSLWPRSSRNISLMRTYYLMAANAMDRIRLRIARKLRDKVDEGDKVLHQKKKVHWTDNKACKVSRFLKDHRGLYEYHKDNELGLGFRDFKRFFFSIKQSLISYQVRQEVMEKLVSISSKFFLPTSDPQKYGWVTSVYLYQGNLVYIRILKTTFTTWLGVPSMRFGAWGSPGKNTTKVSCFAW